MFSFKFKLSQIFLALTLAFAVGCSQSEETPPAAPKGSGPGGEPIVITLSGGLVLTKASLSPIEITSPQIFNELDQQVKDNYSFTVTGEDNVKVAAIGELNINNFTSSVVVQSLNGKIKFQALAPTKVGSYRVAVRPANSIALGRFFISVDPGEVSLLGEIKGNRYEDMPTFNGIKDPDESWTILADGTTTSFLTVGPIVDSFNNKVNLAKIRLTTNQGQIISQNPVGISDGVGFFTLQSPNFDTVVSLQATALDNNDSPIVSVFGNIKAVLPRLEIQEDGNMGVAFVNQTIVKVFTVRNTGTAAVRNITYNVDNPFVFKPYFAGDINTPAVSTCLNKNFLRPTETCTLNVQFTGGIRQLFTGNIQVSGTPTNVSGSTVIKGIQAQAVINAEMRVDNSSVDFGTKTCGETFDQELVISNNGDLPGNNFVATSPPPHPGQTVPYVTFILNPADVNPSPDPNQVINCGSTLPPGRKCRMIVRFRPQALVTSSPLNGSISIDGQVIGITVRGASQPGAPVGVIPVSIITPSEASSGTNTSNDAMLISSDSVAQVTVGPLVDGCNIPVANGYPVNAAVSGGSLVSNSAVTNGGYASFAWRGTDDVAFIGPQTITASSNTALGSKSMAFQGVKLVLTGPTSLGQVLTGRNKTFDYTLQNQGNLPVNFLNLKTNPSVINWGGIDTSYVGGCQDFQLLAGETCTVRFRASPTSAGALTVALIAEDIQAVGQNYQEITISGVAQNPPVLTFTPNSNYNLGTFTAGQPITGVLSLYNVGPAIANSLEYNLSSPFTISSQTCGTTLSNATTCTINVQLTATTAGNYQSLITVNSESAPASANIFASIIPGKANGTIPVVFSTPSVPANATSTISVTMGPIKDAYGNVVVAGTPVNVSTTAGRMSVDTNGDGQEILSTNSNGFVSFTIRSQTTSEITNFTINANVLDTNSAVLASGTQSGSFTGARLVFTSTPPNFGQVAIGRLEVRSVTLQNTGNESITNVVIPQPSSDFPISGQSTCATLAPNASCTFSVTFFPAQAGVRNATITANGSGNGVTSTSIAVTGEGVLPADIVVSPGTLTLDISPGSGASGSFTIKNNGAEALTSLTIASNLRNSEFNFGSLTACQTLSGGQTCTVNFTFTPTSPITNNLNVTITASGVSPSRPTVSSMSLTLRPAFLVYIQKPLTLDLNQCGALQIQVQNNAQTPTPAAGNINLTLGLSGGTGGFYSDSGCNSSISSILISSGSSSSSVFYFKGSATADYTLTASNSVYSLQAIVKVFAPVAFSSLNPNIALGANYTFSATGGVPPYSFSVRTAGGGTIVSGTGVYTAPLTVGAYVIRVTDNLGGFTETNANTFIPHMAAGHGFMCYLTDGNLNCIGAKNSGQWDNASPVSGTYLEKIPVPNLITYTPTAGRASYISSSGNHLCFIRESDSRVYCQGFNNYGQLGNSSTNDSSSGVAAGTISVSAANAANSLSASPGEHTCALNSSGQVYCWGNNLSQQVTGSAGSGSSSPVLVSALGSGNKQIVTTKRASCVIKSDNKVACWGSSPVVQTSNFTSILAPVATGGDLLNIQSLSAGYNHVCAIDSANKLFCWGDNSFGQLGIGSTSATGNTVNTLNNIKKAFLGGFHSCVQRVDDSVSCWGLNNRGQLGNGNTTNQSSPVTISGYGTSYNYISGRYFTCAIGANTVVRCSGDSSFGLLGSTTLFASSATTVTNSTTSCNSGLTYNSSEKSCRCSTSSNIYNFELQGCSSAPSFQTNPPSIQAFSIPSTVNSQSVVVTTSSQNLTDIPVFFRVTSGNGTFRELRQLTDISPQGSVSTTFTKGTTDDTTEFRIGDSNTVKATSIYPTTPTSCNNYVAYGYNSSNNGLLAIYQGGTSVPVYCEFNGGFGYTYQNLTDFNNQYIQVQSPKTAISHNVSCPYSLTIVWNLGTHFFYCADSGGAFNPSGNSCSYNKPFAGVSSGTVTFSDSLCTVAPSCSGSAPYTIRSSLDVGGNPEIFRSQWKCR